MESLQAGVASSIGSRMLSEIDETSLDQILTSLRTNLTTARNNTTERNKHDNSNDDNHNDNADHFTARSSTLLKTFPIPHLDHLVKRHFRATQSAPLAITGRFQELLYLLVATLIAPPHKKAVAIVDCDGRFDALRVLATSPYEDESTDTVKQEIGSSVANKKPIVRRGDLNHVHILRSTRRDSAHVAKCVASVERYMLYASHQSRTREWWGTIVIGGGNNPAGSPSAAAAAQLAITAGWKGWLRVDRTDTPLFLPGIGVEDALEYRENRQNAVEKAGWVASCPWGQFTFSINHSE